MPPSDNTSPGSDGLQAQVLLELGKISTQIAVITEQLKAVPDHEARIRSLEQQNAASTSRDAWARGGSGVAIIGAAAAAIASYLHH